MCKHSRKETNHGTEERDAERPWLAHQGLETDYPSGKDPPVEERQQRTSWLAAPKEVEGAGGHSTDYTQRGEARGGSGGNQGREGK